MNNVTGQEALFRQAFLLSLFTIFYNIAEGLVSVYYGVEEDMLTLFGFGADSFIEALSGTGICFMVWRIQRNVHNTSTFEKTALRITGLSFYLLCAGLVLSCVFRIIHGNTPENTLPGMIISGISILIMWGLVKMKTIVGQKLHSEPILADAGCTRVCIYMSLVLLASSFIYRVTKINYIDIAGTAGIVYFSFREGREAFDKARGRHQCHCG